MKWDGYELEPGIKHIVYQIECGDKTGYYHVQMYLELKRKKPLPWIVKFLGTNKIKADGRIRDPVATMNYCKKENTRIAGPWELGEPSVGQGRRTDIDELYADIRG